MFDKFKNYKRFPIQICRNAFALIHMYEMEDHFEDIFVEEELHYKMCDVDFKEAADQFIKQLEGHTCRAFIEALRDRCNEHIQEDLDSIERMRIKLGKPKDK